MSRSWKGFVIGVTLLLAGGGCAVARTAAPAASAAAAGAGPGAAVKGEVKAGAPVAAPATPPAPVGEHCAEGEEARQFLAEVARSRGGLSPRERPMIDRVVGRLAASITTTGLAQWPPDVEVLRMGSPNAFAACFKAGAGKPTFALVAVSRELLDEYAKLGDGYEAALAFVVGHELGHVALGHRRKNLFQEATAFRQTAYGRGAELDADQFGMEVALKAGYTHEGALLGARRFYELFPAGPHESLHDVHPSWPERLARLDRRQPRLWQATAAFHVGTYLLAAERFQEAAQAFEQVVEDFPDAFEARANLGHAYLMAYADGLDAEAVRKLGIAQISTGTFYRTAASLQAQARTLDPALWSKALQQLQLALKLQPDAALVMADLGVAYLLDPAGPNTEQALWQLAHALKMSANLTTAERFAIGVNFVVAAQAAGERDRAVEMLAALTEIPEAAFEAGDGGAAQQEEGEALEAPDDEETDEASDAEVEELAKRVSARLARGGTAPLGTDKSALFFSLGNFLADSRVPQARKLSVDVFEKYLTSVAPTTPWWDSAYQRYASLAPTVPAVVKPREALAGQRPGRPLVTVAWADGRRISLADPVAAVTKQLGPVAPVPVIPGEAPSPNSLVRLAYADRGVEVVAADVVLAIQLSGERAPSLQLRAQGLGGAETTLTVGMPVKALRERVGKEPAHAPVFGPERHYALWPELNLGAAYDHGVVTELVVLRHGGED